MSARRPPPDAAWSAHTAAASSATLSAISSDVKRTLSAHRKREHRDSLAVGASGMEVQALAVAAVAEQRARHLFSAIGVVWRTS
jgi:hypothetical protein